ncbi:MAG: glycosyltransferase [Candidatus Riflebacteria bacterium]|nr:glycosyltransferase [Candidatus Riflebacteria bacterium]
MRILQIINALTLGGAQFILLDLARHARREGCEVEVACFRDGPIGGILRQEGFTVHVLGESHLDIPAFLRLIGILTKFRPDIVHSHLFRATFWARICCWLPSHIKLITSIHGCESTPFHYLERLLSRFSNFLIFPSRSLRDWYVKRIKARKSEECSVIYPGVDISSPSITHQTSAKVRIGTLSRLHPVKGIDRLINACSRLKHKGIAFELIIGGDGRHRHELNELASKLEIADCCRFCGEISDRQSFLDELDIFVAPSRQEAFGIHICEAMERSLPVVGARVGGIPELIEHGKTGILFDPERPDELADALAKLAKDRQLRSTLGINARNRVEKLFNRESAVARHLELFKRICEVSCHVHFAVSSGELGGGERVALGLIRSLLARGWRVSATCCGEPLAAAIARAGAEVSVSNMRGGGFFFALKLMADLCRLRPGIISSHLNRASLAAGLLGRLCRVPSIAHIHGLNNQSYYRFSDCLIAVSKAVKEHVVSQNAAHKDIRVIANRIDKPPLSPRNTVGEPLRLVITAKLHKNKGHLWALEAISRNIELIGDIHIDILGEGPERAILEEYCHNSNLRNRVTLHGFVSDPEAFYHNIDIAMLPSLGEGIPLSLLEAMRWGIPCIATRIGGIPEIVENDQNGILVEPGNEEALIAAIKKIRGDYTRFSTAAVEHFRRINDYSAMIDEFEDLLLQTMRENQ